MKDELKMLVEGMYKQIHNGTIIRSIEGYGVVNDNVVYGFNGDEYPIPSEYKEYNIHDLSPDERSSAMEIRNRFKELNIPTADELAKLPPHIRELVLSAIKQ